MRWVFLGGRGCSDAVVVRDAVAWLLLGMMASFAHGLDLGQYTSGSIGKRVLLAWPTGMASFAWFFPVTLPVERRWPGPAVPVFRAEGWNGDGDGDNSLSQLCGLDGESEDIGLVAGLAAGADAGADGDGGLVLFSAGLASTDLDDSARQFVGADTVTASLIGAVVL